MNAIPIGRQYVTPKERQNLAKMQQALINKGLWSKLKIEMYDPNLTIKENQRIEKWGLEFLMYLWDYEPSKFKRLVKSEGIVEQANYVEVRANEIREFIHRAWMEKYPETNSGTDLEKLRKINQMRFYTEEMTRAELIYHSL